MTPEMRIRIPSRDPRSPGVQLAPQNRSNVVAKHEIPPDTRAAIVGIDSGLMYIGPNHGAAACDAEDDGAFTDPGLWVSGFYSEITGFLDRDEFVKYCGVRESIEAGRTLGISRSELGCCDSDDGKADRGWAAEHRSGQRVFTAVEYCFYRIMVEENGGI